jgi:branched-chain amino acid transport system substrate-binding protein
MASPRTLKVGIPVSLSGQFQVQGRQALTGLQAWAEDVNRAGGLDFIGVRVPVSVVHYDDASRPEQVRRATERLIVVDKVDLLLGPYSSVLAQAATGVAEQHQRLLWNQGGAADSIYQQGYRWVVGILTPASEYLSGLAPLVREAAPDASTLAILRSASGAFPRAVSSGVERGAVALGFRTVLRQEYDPATADFPQVLEAVERARPDVLVAVGRIQDDLRLAQLLARRRPPIGAVAVVAAPIQQFQDALGEQVEGFLGPSQWEPVGTPRQVGAVPLANHYGPSAQQVLASLRRQGRNAIDYPMVQAYAAALVAQRCVEAAGTLEHGALREAAAALDFSTFYGRFKIDPDTGRQIGRSVVIVQWQRDRKVIVWPPEQRQARLIYPWRQRSQRQP